MITLACKEVSDVELISLVFFFSFMVWSCVTHEQILWTTVKWSKSGDLYIAAYCKMHKKDSLLLQSFSLLPSGESFFLQSPGAKHNTKIVLFMKWSNFCTVIAEAWIPLLLFLVLHLFFVFFFSIFLSWYTKAVKKHKVCQCQTLQPVRKKKSWLMRSILNTKRNTELRAVFKSAIHLDTCQDSECDFSMLAWWS